MTSQISLEGKMLIAMPGMSDPRFERSVVYLCAHSDQGALGFVINKTVQNITFEDLLEQLELNGDETISAPPVHFGGPVETERGFVIHTSDYAKGDTAEQDGDIGITATLDILRAIAEGRGPEKSILVLGYAGWAPGQLEQELSANGWLHCDANLDLVFAQDNDRKWDRALASLGVDAGMLSSDAGRA